MVPVRVFSAFDADHDGDLHAQLVKQCESAGSPLCVADHSRPHPVFVADESSLRERMAHVDFVVVLCSEHTANAAGVATELRIAREQGKPYLLLRGRRHVDWTVPCTAQTNDPVYTWTWPVLSEQVGVVMRRGVAASKRGPPPVGPAS